MALQEQELTFWPELSEAERLHFRHLVMIRPQVPSEGQLRMLSGLATTLTHPRLITLMARTPHWLSHWEILGALAGNEAAPESIRRDLELVVSLFDLMREMDAAPAADKAERADVVKGVYQQLRPELKPVAKLLAKQLAKPIGGTGSTLEMPSLPEPDQDWEALTLPPAAPVAQVVLTHQDRVSLASGSENPSDILFGLLADQDDLRQAAMGNPMLSEDIVCQALQLSPVDGLFDEIYGEARWYFREGIREAILEAPSSPEDLCRRIALSRHLVELLGRGSHSRISIQRAVSLFAQLDESEYQYVTYWCKRHAPHLLRVVKYFYDRQRRQAGSPSGGLGRESQGQWASLEERVFLATQSTASDQLAQLLRDPDPQVFRLTLENPALTPRLLHAAIPVLERERIDLLATHHAWGRDPEVRESLLHNPLLGENQALGILDELNGIKALVEVVKDPRVPHLEVKRRALERLRELYQEIPSEERLTALRSYGAELMRHLPQEVLQDEASLRLLVADRQLDPSLLLRLARNKLTPRGILELIAAHPVLLAHTAIMSELLLNPKTPRESSLRLWGLMSEAEQQQLLKSPHLPTTLRHLA
ncbi:MAG TPA: hypothetical protein VJ505_00330 [Holophagaceae bacterium]|nr:hypothetical protein [Holophagaceae bacterium]